MSRSFFFLLAISFVVFSAQVRAVADDNAKVATKVSDAKINAMAAKGVAYLKASQAEDGSFSGFSGIGITALATNAMLQSGVSASDEAVVKGLKYLEKQAKPDGGIYKKGSIHRNYETCLNIICFTSANKDGKYDNLIKKADAFVKGLQWDEKEGKAEDDFDFGGAGYGKHKRPDMSNTTFLVEALIAAGNDENSEAIQRALKFISRSQNLESEENTTPFAAKVDDGGFYYTPAAGGQSQAGTTQNGGLRSYGSMTYAGLKSMIYAGVGPDDQRVKAAVGWIKKNFTLERNPGMPKLKRAEGLFYYYHMFAKALDAMGEDIIVDESGKKHNWRAELVEVLGKHQASNGSWVNKGSERWLEGDANLVTSYALLALAHCRAKKKSKK